MLGGNLGSLLYGDVSVMHPAKLHSLVREFIFLINMSRLIRKSVFSVSDEVLHKPGCTPQKIARG